MAFVENGASSVGEHEAGRFLRFTSRDLSILQLVSEGCTNVQIGSRLYISKYTVAQHIAKMLKQAGASNRTDLVNQAYRAGVLRSAVDVTPEYG